MGLNGVSLSSLVIAKQMAVYSPPATQKVEKASQRQSSGQRSFKEEAFFQGKDSNQNITDELIHEKEKGVELPEAEANTYTLRLDQPGVEQIIPTGKTIKREA